jgi:hypothetical protein
MLARTVCVSSGTTGTLRWRRKMNGRRDTLQYPYSIQVWIISDSKPCYCGKKIRVWVGEGVAGANVYGDSYAWHDTKKMIG